MLCRATSGSIAQAIEPGPGIGYACTSVYFFRAVFSQRSAFNLAGTGRSVGGFNCHHLAFLLVQLKVDLPAKNSLTLLWFLLSVGGEIWVIGVLNRLVG